VKARICIIEHKKPGAVVCGLLLSHVGDCELCSVTDQGLVVSFDLYGEQEQVILDNATINSDGRISQAFDVNKSKTQEVHVYFIGGAK
jgi:hypothetical protein